MAFTKDFYNAGNTTSYRYEINSDTLRGLLAKKQTVLRGITRRLEITPLTNAIMEKILFGWSKMIYSAQEK